MGSIEELQSFIDAATTAAETLVSALTQSRQYGDDLAEELDGMSVHGTADQIREAVIKLDEAIALLGSIQRKADEAHTTAEAAKETLRPDLGQNTRAAPARPVSESPIPTEAATAKTCDPNPHLIDMPTMPPKTKRGRGMPQHPTHGRWVGRSEFDRKLQSGADEETRAVDELWSRVRRPDEVPSLMIATHVEPKFAVRMRRQELKNETIVINNPDGPCGYATSLRYGCDQILPRLLPPGASLTVYWPDGNQHTYHGVEES
ncbi:DddA-like double-stranded DNA deaminase toxin [Stackebrandtia albiflava]|nr:DddA-like double-stranded DNA deaminase toxin [Stackebrandtia albiflava]